MKINVVLTAYKQTSYEEYTHVLEYTHVFKTVSVDIPDDGLDWHVAGEMEGED